MNYTKTIFFISFFSIFEVLASDLNTVQALEIVNDGIATIKTQLIKKCDDISDFTSNPILKKQIDDVVDSVGLNMQTIAKNEKKIRDIHSDLSSDQLSQKIDSLNDAVLDVESVLNSKNKKIAEDIARHASDTVLKNKISKEVNNKRSEVDNSIATKSKSIEQKKEEVLQNIDSKADEFSNTANNQMIEPLDKMIKSLNDKTNDCTSSIQSIEQYYERQYQKEVLVREGLNKNKSDLLKRKAGIEFNVESEDRLANSKYYSDLDNQRYEFSNKLKLEKLQHLIDSIFKVISSPEHMMKVSGAVSGSIGGILFFKNAWPIVRKYVEELVMTPQLVDATSMKMKFFWQKDKEVEQKLKNLFYAQELQQAIEEIIFVLSNTKKNGGYYLNYLFYGEPGTGKTATARALAAESGMDWAIMTGGNVQKLLSSGKAEERLKEVFGWASKSRKGLVLFIDEADAFLKDPNSNQMTEQLYAVLNSFLNLTGTESRDICIIMSTNHPSKLPKAVLDRVGPGQFIYFGLPGLKERAKIIQHFSRFYFDKYEVVDGQVDEPQMSRQKSAQSLNQQDTMGASSSDAQEVNRADHEKKQPRKKRAVAAKARLFTVDMILHIAKKTEGFSGRNLSYIMLAIEKAMLAQKEPILTIELIDHVLSKAVTQHKQALQFKSYA